MKLKIAVTDANIFIDLFELELTPAFFKLEFEFHTSSAVYFELFPEQQEVLKFFQSKNRLTVHNLQEQDFQEIYLEKYPKSLSEADKSVLYIANKINAIVLSSDKTLRNYAQKKGIEYHGMLWIFDQLIETKILNQKEAREKLELLVRINFLFRNNQKLLQEIETRLKRWI
ncbi:hypothetical protein MASR2M44_12060 [Bacteroidota bacterium]